LGDEALHSIGKLVGRRGGRGERDAEKGKASFHAR
jgi:hypothetical protein